MMDNKFIRYLVVMFFAFVVDSLLCYYLPSSLLKINLTIVPYGAVAMFVLLNNSIDNDHRTIFAVICGFYYSVIYGNSLFIYVVLYLLYAFIVLLTIFVQECVLYSLMWISNTTQLLVTTFLIKRLLPTLLYNAVMFNGVYYIHHKIKLEGDIDVYFS